MKRDSLDNHPAWDSSQAFHSVKPEARQPLYDAICAFMRAVGVADRRDDGKRFAKPEDVFLQAASVAAWDIQNALAEATIELHKVTSNLPVAATAGLCAIAMQFGLLLSAFRVPSVGEEQSDKIIGLLKAMANPDFYDTSEQERTVLSAILAHECNPDGSPLH